MPGLKQGQVVTKENLNVFLYSGGNLSDPFSINYTILDSTTGSDVVIGMPNRIPIKFNVGSFYAPWTVPDDEPVGAHKITWRYKESSTSVEKVDTEEFQIISKCAAEGFVYPDSIRYLIVQLRARLRDINPDRDYHFQPPTGEATIHGFTNTRGYRWPDEQLYYHLVQAANYINLVPPDTGFSLENYPAVWTPILIQQSMIYALFDLAILWINEEFSYSLNGISLDISRSDKYSGIAQSLQAINDTQLTSGKSRLHFIAGLAQNRFTYGRGAALGPWCLHKDMMVFDLGRYVEKNINELIQQITIKEAYEKQIKFSYSMDENNELIINEVNKIWCNGIQDLYKMNTEKNEIICTETHKFFNEKSEEKMLKELKIGDQIWINENDKLILDKITSIEYFGKDETYDMEMVEPYRNYVANSFVVHNTGGQNIRRWVLGNSSSVGGGGAYGR